MDKINLRLFRKKAILNRPFLKRFLSSLERNPLKGLDKLALSADIEMWQKTDCLQCANCCKTMSPTYTRGDMLRISAHVGMSVIEFQKKYLKKDRQGDWVNRVQPCQFLNLEDNKCSIYEVRPRDCAGFPHHTKKRMVDYMHVYKQNIEFCPATYRFVEIMRRKVSDEISKYKNPQ